MKFENCTIDNGVYKFQGHEFYNFADFARYIASQGGRIWYKSGNVIKVQIKER